jgi:hypothetical protein
MSAKDRLCPIREFSIAEFFFPARVLMCVNIFERAEE